jgi:histidine triad (HIT) family protein
MAEPSVFTKIMLGEIPGEIIYEDKASIALLSHQPITPGHTLIIPRQQIDQLWDLDETTYHHLFDVTKLIAARLGSAYDYERIGLLAEGFGVSHAHLHVFGYHQPLEPTIEEHIAHKHTASPEELHAVAELLKST